MTIRAVSARQVGLAALAAALAALLLIAAPATAKKKAKGPGAVDITKALNLPIPDRPTGATSQYGLLTSTIDVGSQFRGKRVRDVNVTVQTAGTSGTTPAETLFAILYAPNGVHSLLFSSLFAPPGPNLSIGPLTLDDEASLNLGGGPPQNSTRLFAPWAGSAAPLGPLFPLDNGQVTGTWTLKVLDVVNAETSNLVSWRLNVVAGKPFRTK